MRIRVDNTVDSVVVAHAGVLLVLTDVDCGANGRSPLYSAKHLDGAAVFHNGVQVNSFGTVNLRAYEFEVVT